jgi:hypothetical protein
LQDRWIERLEYAAVRIAVIGCACILGVFVGAVLEVMLWDTPEIPLRLPIGLLVGCLAAITWMIFGPAWMDPPPDDQPTADRAGRAPFMHGAAPHSPLRL